jgi:DNA-binding beta-propeller fold protein YncE
MYRNRLGFTLLALSSLIAIAAPTYKLTKSISVAGEGGWDYLYADSPNRKLYVSHGTEVDVLNLDKGDIAGKITDLKGVHGIAIADDLKKGFISDGGNNRVVIFDLKSLAKTGEAKAGENPDAIIYDPYSKRVFAFNGRSKDATAIDAQTGNVVGTVPLDGKPEFAVTDGAGNLYDNIEDRNELVRINPRSLKVMNQWSLSPCDSPSGLAMDATHRRVFPVCENKMMAVVDADSGKVITTVPTGAGTDASAFDPNTMQAFSSNGRDGTLTVIDEKSPNEFRVAQNVKTRDGARTMALDLKTNTIYLSDADFAPVPAPTSETQRFRRKIVPGSFRLLVVSP